jgi:hypothetical protein
MALLRIGLRSARKSALCEGLRTEGRIDTVYPAVGSGGLPVLSSQPLFAIVGGRPCWTWRSLQYWSA